MTRHLTPTEAAAGAMLKAKPLPSVEDVARIIDPEAMEYPLDDPPHPDFVSWQAVIVERRNVALTKATTILALIRGEGE